MPLCSAFWGIPALPCKQTDGPKVARLGGARPHEETMGRCYVEPPTRYQLTAGIHC